MKHLEGLNPEQRAAVEHFEGPILALAGAGSGKTRVLTTRIVNLIETHGVDPSAILAVTFTNKAAGEMRNRIRKMLGEEPAGMWMGTFHSLGARLLRRHATRMGYTPNFSIYDSDQSLREIKRTMEKLNINPKRWHPEAIRSAISAAKNQLVNPDEYAKLAGDAFTLVVADVYPRYQESLREQNAFDFDDLLVKPVELFLGIPEILETYRRRFHFVLVDEYQDTNHAQYKFLDLLSRQHANLMVVGDDDQSIYGWRGADIRNILDFEKDYPNTRTIRLEQNYRSTGNILEAANHIIALNKRRKGKTLRTDQGPGDIITKVESLDERDEAEWITTEIERLLQTFPLSTPRDFVILYRTNSQSRAMEEALNRHAMPYQIIGGTRFYERREIMDVLAYLRLISNPRDAGAFDRVVNYPRRGIGDTSKTTLLTWATEKRLTPLEASLIAEECSALRGAAVASFKKFAEMIQRYTALAAHLKGGELLEKLVEEVGLLDALREEGPEGDDRIENVRELIAGAHAFEVAELEEELPEQSVDNPPTQLDLYLQRVSLITDVDKHDPDAKAVTLMTLHNAKGLEYPYVFISGLEDGLFPMARAFDEPDQLEEERRLFYVGITRAEKKLYMTFARTRRRAGEVLACIPSSFLAPLPAHLVESMVTPSLKRVRYQGESSWRGGSAARYNASKRRDEDTSSGTWIDYSDAQEAPRFVKNERVRHPQFGRGIIRELSGFGQDLKAVIDFESVGRKKVVVRYANLQKEL